MSLTKFTGKRRLQRNKICIHIIIGRAGSPLSRILNTTFTKWNDRIKVLILLFWKIISFLHCQICQHLVNWDFVGKSLWANKSKNDSIRNCNRSLTHKRVQRKSTMRVIGLYSVPERHSFFHTDYFYINTDNSFPLMSDLQCLLPK